MKKVLLKLGLLLVNFVILFIAISCTDEEEFVLQKKTVAQGNSLLNSEELIKKPLIFMDTFPKVLLDSNNIGSILDHNKGKQNLDGTLTEWPPKKEDENSPCGEDFQYFQVDAATEAYLNCLCSLQNSINTDDSVYVIDDTLKLQQLINAGILKNTCNGNLNIDFSQYILIIGTITVAHTGFDLESHGLYWDNAKNKYVYTVTARDKVTGYTVLMTFRCWDVYTKFDCDVELSKYYILREEE
ncbi:MAG: hypothetical protein IJ759_06960 [Bacteroidales bacterium]|nr:hypothetical protein [Bacteroidales bacterium]